MKVVIDTNVALTLFKKRHANRPIYDAWTAGKLDWAVSTEILLEYEEIAVRIHGSTYAALILRVITAVGAWRGNVLHVSPSFRFRAIPADPDDDKFADCAIAAHADYIITEDRHFRPLVGAGFRPQPITPEVFIAQHLVS
jgi:putative PIN family toxin of toxin-antitoxin system